MKFQSFMTFQVFHDLYERIFSLTPISWSCSGNIGETRSSRPTKAIRAVLSKGGVTDTESAAAVTVAVEAGFYLGYLRGRSFPPPQKKKIIFCHQYGKLYQKNHPDATRSVHTM